MSDQNANNTSDSQFRERVAILIAAKDATRRAEDQVRKIRKREHTSVLWACLSGGATMLAGFAGIYALVEVRPQWVSPELVGAAFGAFIAGVIGVLGAAWVYYLQQRGEKRGQWDRETVALRHLNDWLLSVWMALMDLGHKTDIIGKVLPQVPHYLRERVELLRSLEADYVARDLAHATGVSRTLSFESAMVMDSLRELRVRLLSVKDEGPHQATFFETVADLVTKALEHSEQAHDQAVYELTLRELRLGRWKLPRRRNSGQQRLPHRSSPPACGPTSSAQAAQETAVES